VPRTVFSGDQTPEIRVVWVLIPLVVVAEIATSVVRRIGKDKIDLATVLVKRYHRLEVFSLDDQVRALQILLAYTELLLDALPSWLDPADNLPGRCLATVCKPNSTALFCITSFEEPDKLLAA
jgi:hypothetical protein